MASTASSSTSSSVSGLVIDYEYSNSSFDMFPKDVSIVHYMDPMSKKTDSVVNVLITTAITLS